MSGRGDKDLFILAQALDPDNWRAFLRDGVRAMSGSPRIMAHMVAFYPDRAGVSRWRAGLAEGGSAYLELQFPFSDPTADGPDIQRACSAALEAGFTVNDGFRLVAEIMRLCPPARSSS